MMGLFFGVFAIVAIGVLCCLPLAIFILCLSLGYLRLELRKLTSEEIAEGGAVVLDDKSGDRFAAVVEEGDKSGDRYVSEFVIKAKRGTVLHGAIKISTAILKLQLMLLFVTGLYGSQEGFSLLRGVACITRFCVGATVLFGLALVPAILLNIAAAKLTYTMLALRVPVRIASSYWLQLSSSMLGGTSSKIC
ncbi:expressed unknown protein [Seminavis robusta]|uniref:Uncharacterized protein n=1 Tax=Seminavis robusta TaxID=568900 RepID=A0A9N8DD51_9STRA|nr:expressed unknown protein [Seminavis robusta]|eukprot:Sro65_g036560.1 n/a (192) ;mRNA; r:16230-16900